MARTRKNRRGGGYGFAGSLMGASASNGGNQRWDSDTGKDCGATANRGGNGTFGGKRKKSRRGGQMDPARPPVVSRKASCKSSVSHTWDDGEKKCYNNKTGQEVSVVVGKSRRGGNLTLNRGGNGGGRRRRGGARGGNGNPDLAQNIPRTNYSFQGDGSAGMVNWAPDSY